LVENTFNKVKSQLKVIEAGFHKKAIIAQDFGPYKIDLVSAYERPKNKNEEPKFNESANAYMIDSSRNHKLWYHYIKKLINNPEQIKILGDNLYNTVIEKYSIEKVTEDRRNLYKSLVKK